MKLLKTKTGYSVRYKTEFGMRTTRLSSTSEKEARKEIKDAKIAELEAAANAGALTMDVYKMMSGRNMTCQDALDEWNDWRSQRVSRIIQSIHRPTLFIYSAGDIMAWISL